MAQIQITVHPHDRHEPIELTLDDELTIADLLQKVSPGKHDDLLLFIEGESAPRERGHRLRECIPAGQRHLHCRTRVIEYKVDGEKQQTEEHKLTASAIMTNAGVDPAFHYLIWLKGRHHQESFKDRQDESIRMHNGMEFITASLAPTTVS